MEMTTKSEALEYHEKGRHGKIEVKPTKPCLTQSDLSLAYTPGVAEPCLQIKENPDEFIRVVKLLEPTFGGVNLEDIRAPECFYIEERLIEEMSIPVFHDDQHGTAIISGAGFLNALELVGKRIDEVKVVFNGAGAAGIACAKIYNALGVKRENMILCDSKGVIYKGRTEGMNPYKEAFAAETSLRTLEEAVRGADAFIGISVGGVLTKEMVKTMADKPIIFAMANPYPEIRYEDAKEARPDAIVATGRSDYPNQVNNVLGFPFIFRGALDVRATRINEEMKVAAVHALADLAKEDVPDSVRRAYGVESMRFGPDYIIPKPFDPRVLVWVASAVAKAAMDSGVARIKLDIEKYKDHLRSLLSKSEEVMRLMVHRAMEKPKVVVFPEGENEKIIRASKILGDERMAKPVLLGHEEKIRRRFQELGLSDENVEIVEPSQHPRIDEYSEDFYRLRCRKGVTCLEAKELMRRPSYFASMMVRMGDADCMIAGLTQHYPESIRPPLQVIGVDERRKRVAATHIMMVKDKVYFFADTSVNIEPDAEDLAEIAILTAGVAQSFRIEPKIAMLSFSNFGSVRHPLTEKVRRAVEIVRHKRPELKIDGEMQAETALNKDLQREFFKCCTLQDEANVLIFPDLQSANIGYKLIQSIAEAEIIGPILMGMRKPVHILIRSSEVRDIVNMAVVASVQAIEREERARG